MDSGLSRLGAGHRPSRWQKDLFNNIRQKRSFMHRAIRASVANHPRARGRKTFRAAPGFSDEARRLGRTAAAARSVRGLVFGNRLRRVGRALIGGVGLALVRGHAEEIGRGQNDPRRFTRALRTILRRVAFRHRPHIGEWTATPAKIFIDRHFIPHASTSQHSPRRMRGGRYSSRPAPTSRRDHLSGDSDTSTPPLMCLIGPADDGMMSKSKISVGRYSVAQAFGISTTPLICPCTGATPRIV